MVDDLYKQGTNMKQAGRAKPFARLHTVISQKSELFIITAVRISNTAQKPIYLTLLIKLPYFKYNVEKYNSKHEKSLCNNTRCEIFEQGIPL
jgi:hypothetical protein